MKNSQNLAETIEILAKEKGVSVSSILQELDMNKNALFTMKNSGYLPRVESLCKFADYFQCSLDYLIGRTDEPTSNTNITGNTQNNINGSNNIGTAPASADGISEKFMQIFNNLPFEQQLEIMSLALEKSKKI